MRRRGAGRKPIAETDPNCLRRSRRSSRRTVAAIRCRCCCGPPRACARSLPSCASVATRPLHDGRGAVALAWLQLAVQSQDQGGRSASDRDAQFRHINERVSAAITAGQPAISIDTKRRSSSASSRTPGANGTPRAAATRQHARLPSMATGKAIPYGVYDIASTRASSTSRSPPRRRTSRRIDPSVVGRLGASATRRHVAADHRRLRRRQRQPHAPVEGRAAAPRRRNRADDRRLPLPAGTSKWNKIEHRLFCHISHNGADGR